MGSSPKERKGNKYPAAQNGTALGMGSGGMAEEQQSQDFVLVHVRKANLARTSHGSAVARVGDGAEVGGDHGTLGSFRAADLIIVRDLGLRRGILWDKANPDAPVVRMRRGRYA
ncbi:hypothetical protein [Gemmatimonas aurantiaca]|nr:hypothetical protein [Gemmatimonas aurantiaca]